MPTRCETCNYFVLSFVHVSQLWKGVKVLVLYCGFCTTESHYRAFRARSGRFNGHCGGHWTSGAWLLQNDKLIQLSCLPSNFEEGPSAGLFLNYNGCCFSIRIKLVEETVLLFTHESD